MRRMSLIALSMICVLASVSCTSAGKRPSTPLNCPRPSPPPANLMVAPTTGSKVRAELLAPPTSATPR